MCPFQLSIDLEYNPSFLCLMTTGFILLLFRREVHVHVDNIYTLVINGLCVSEDKRCYISDLNIVNFATFITI